MSALSFIEPSFLDKPKYSEWPFAGLEPFAYSLIVADPPWRFITRSKRGEGKSPQAHYSTMTIDDIRALPVADLAHENCLLWMWATQPMLDQQISIMQTWGFKFISAGAWVKTTKNDKRSFGTGYWFRECAEYILLGTRGKPKRISRSVRSAFLSPQREHSRKPDESYDMARALIPYGRACELFSRQRRPGWDVWGNEVDKFSTEDNHADSRTSTRQSGRGRGQGAARGRKAVDRVENSS
jgi:N6-adenosine-specific RNA methylase IME4